MAKKLIAVIALAVLAIFAVPTAAMATGYVPPSNVSSSGGNSTAPGGATTVSFSSGSFSDSETVTVTATGDPAPALAVIGSATKTYAATATGGVSFKVIIPTDATASSVYTISAVGNTSGNVGTYRIAVSTADTTATAVTSSSGLAFTGGSISMLIVWAGAGILALGVALLIVRGVVRRQRAQA